MSRTEDLNWFFGSTKVGQGILLFGLYWLISYFTPLLLKTNIGFLHILIVPASILLCGGLLIAVLKCSITLEDLVTQWVYSIFISYMIVNVIKDMGWIGVNVFAEIISYVIIWLAATYILFSLRDFPKVLSVLSVLLGVVIFCLLFFLFIRSAIEIIQASGWLDVLHGWLASFYPDVNDVLCQ